MEVRLDGKTALITGGSLGLGRAMAVRFAEAGASVAIAARQPGPLEEARQAISEAGAENRVCAISCDVSDAGACSTLHDDVARELGPIDILVNNAGTSQRGPFLEITDDMWQHDFDLKLFAAIRLSRLALPGMRARGWGRILNVLNVGAKAPPAEGAPTAVSRAAGLALTKVLANEGAADNVLVNALLVGLIDSNQHRVRHDASGSGDSYEAFLDEMAAANRIPLGRIGRPEEFADIACFLASDRASYVTGVAINVDGGRSPVV